MDFVTGLSVIKQTLDITKDLRNVDARISDAEYKLKIIDLVERLQELQQAFFEAQGREFELQKTIADLKLQLADRGAFADDDGLLYKLDAAGKPAGEPYCNHCFVKEEKLYRLLYGPYHAGSHKCCNCNQIYGSRGRSSTYEPLVRVRGFGEDYE